MHAFQAQDTALTLAQGLEEYYAANAGLKRCAGVSSAAQEFFRCHDAVHVIYGCGISLPHEAVVKLSSFFGTDAGFSVMRGYQLYESQDIYRALGLGEILATIGVAIYLVPRTLIRCANQQKRWPWSDFAQHLDRPLRDIRQEFAIRVA